MKTVPAPSGIGAPVKIRIAWPGLIASSAEAPAWMRPDTGKAASFLDGRSSLRTA
jgi:hypothetical protein